MLPYLTNSEYERPVESVVLGCIHFNIEFVPDRVGKNAGKARHTNSLDVAEEALGSRKAVLNFAVPLLLCWLHVQTNNPREYS